MSTSKDGGPAMSPEAQRIAIAEACGYFPMGVTAGKPWWGTRTNPSDKYAANSFFFDGLPPYLTDLNAMHEAVRSQLANESFSWSKYCEYLTTKHGRYGAIDATAAQRAEAFLAARSATQTRENKS